MNCEECGSQLEAEAVADPQIDFIDIVCGECGFKNKKSLSRELQKEEVD